MADPFESLPASDEPRDVDISPTLTPSVTGPTKAADSGTRIVTSWHILSLLLLLMTLLLFVAAFLRAEQQRVVAAKGDAAPPPAPSPTEVLGPEVAGLKTQIDNLTAKLQGFQEKVDNLPKPEPAAELAPIRVKVDQLARSVAAVTPVAEDVGTLRTRVGGVDAALKSLKEEVSGLKEEIQTLATTKPNPTIPAPGPSAPAVAAEATPPPPDADAPDLSEGINLFKAGKYKEAGDFFKGLESAQPNDARVYYYEAFVNGLITKDWKGETLKLASKGAELEKSGATKSADIDAAFADLSPNLKSWLTFFRSQVK